MGASAFPWDLLELLTPWHLAWDSEGVLVRISAPLRKLWRTEDPLPVLESSLKLLRPFEGKLDSAWLPELTNLSLQLFHTSHPDLVFRGQVIAYDGLWLLVGSPAVHSVEDLARLGLKLSDLPDHYGIGEMLVAVETSLASHHETSERSEQLKQANEELRDVNAALSGFVPRNVLKSLGLDEGLRGDAGTRAMAVGRFIEHLQGAVQFRERFLAAMSHELRTPLNVILGVIETLLEGIYGALTSKQDEMLRSVQDSSGHLLSLINDVLDLSRIEAGAEGLRIGECNLDALCNSAIQMIRPEYKKKGLGLIYENRSTQESISADGRRIRQVLLNLLGNAVKFTDKGDISLLVDDLPSENSVRISVADGGIGIAPEFHGQVFEPFFQVDQGLSRKHQGTGLGLAISRRALELHGGRIELESDMGKGSCFSLVLPVKPTQPTIPSERYEETSGSSEAVSIAGKEEPADTAPGGLGPLAPWLPEIRPFKERDTSACVLVVDDVADNRAHLVDYLEHHGFKTEIADSGLTALQRISDGDIDAVLLDIQMPGMNGLDVIRCLRAMPATRAMPIVALTGWATDRESCMDAGASAFRAKPYSLSELLELIGLLLDQVSLDQEEEGK